MSDFLPGLKASFLASVEAAGGPTNAARLLNFQQSHLSEACSPNYPKAAPRADHALTLQHLTKTNYVLAYMADALGYSLELKASKQDATSLNSHLPRLIKETAELEAGVASLDGKDPDTKAKAVALLNEALESRNAHDEVVARLRQIVSSFDGFTPLRQVKP